MDTINLLQQYIDSWKAHDIMRILSIITEDCTIIESHGPIYRGKQEIEKWFQSWVNNDFQVEVWDVSSTYKDKDVIICEWNFSYSQHGKIQEIFYGITVVHISAEKIRHLQEYRMINKQLTMTMHSE